jgi:serine/threonine protein kinase
VYRVSGAEMSTNVKPSLLDLLRDSSLLEDAQITELAALPEATLAEPLPLARQVVQRGWLTKFQVSQVANGRARDLLVGPYVLLERLGEGGMGQVFKARHRHMGREVALKIIRKEKLASPDAVKRFYAEVRAAGQLQHPNIVVAYDAGQAGTTHFLSMEYVDGIDLARQVKENGPLPVAQACDHVRQAALGLQHAHEKGLVHRDIKPHNLLLTRENGKAVVKILDMGLARLTGGLDQERALTQTGAVIGTPDYLAPEQAVSSRAADIRSDLYSLGCTLHFLLTGRAPFTAESLTQILLQHQMEEPPPLEQGRPDVPPAVAAIVKKLLAKRPEDRFQTPAELAWALEPLSIGADLPAGTAARPLAGAEPAWTTLAEEDQPVQRARHEGRDRSRSSTQVLEGKAGRRGKRRATRRAGGSRRKGLLIAGLIGGPVLLLMVVLAAVLLGDRGREDPDPQPKPPPVVLVNQDKPAPVNKVEPPRSAGKNDPPPPPPAGKNDPPPPREEKKPVEIRDPGIGPNRPGPDAQAPVQLTVVPENVPISHPLRNLTGVYNQTTQVVFLGDGSVAAIGNNRLTTWDPAVEKPEKQWQPVPIRGMVPLPGGRQVLGIEPTTGKACRLLDLKTGEVKREFTRDGKVFRSLAVSPDGRRFATVDDAPVKGGYPICVWDLETGKPMAILQGHSDRVIGMVFTPDGRQLLSGGRDAIRVWDLAGGALVRRFSVVGRIRGCSSLRVVTFTADGRQAAILGSEPIGYVMTVCDTVTGRKLREMVFPRKPFASIRGAVFVDNGPRLLIWGVRTRVKFLASSLWLLDGENGKVLRQFDEHRGGIWSAAISPDRRLIASSGDDSIVRLWDLGGRD